MTVAAPSAPPTAAQREAARAKALAHPLRHEIFLVLAEREASPKEMAEHFGEKLHTVMYHFRFLAGKVSANDVPLIELVATDRKHGGTQHFWKAIERPLITAEMASDLPQEVREESSASIVPRVVDDIAGARAAGTFDAHPERSLLRFHEEFDEQGIRESAQAAEAHQRALEEIAARSKNRIAKGAKAVPMAAQTLIFPIPSVYFTGT